MNNSKPRYSHVERVIPNKLKNESNQKKNYKINNHAQRKVFGLGGTSFLHFTYTIYK